MCPQQNPIFIKILNLEFLFLSLSDHPPTTIVACLNIFNWIIFLKHVQAFWNIWLVETYINNDYYSVVVERIDNFLYRKDKDSYLKIHISRSTWLRKNTHARLKFSMNKQLRYISWYEKKKKNASSSEKFGVCDGFYAF